MPKKVVVTDQAPKAIGPYSQANMINVRTLVFVAGQVPINPATGQIVSGGICVQTHQSLKNVSNILVASGSSIDKVVKTTVYLKNLDDFKEMNEVYSAYFTQDFPARATVQVARLPLDALVEIDAIGYIEELVPRLPRCILILSYATNDGEEKMSQVKIRWISAKEFEAVNEE